MRSESLPAAIALGILLVSCAAGPGDRPASLPGDEADEEGQPPEVITVTGALGDEGVECQALRSDEGDLYTLTGDLAGFGPGDRVRVVGRPVRFSFCMQGTTLQVESIERAG